MIYSPSQTKAHQTCPVYWGLTRLDGWQPRIIGRKELAGLLGTAVAAGAATYHTSLKGGVPTPDIVTSSISSSLEALQTGRQAYADLGCVVRPEEQSLSDSLEFLVCKTIEQYIDAAPIPPTWEILDVEWTIPDSGNSRLDLGVQTPLGLSVADLKCKLRLDPWYRNKTLDEYAIDPQLRHYSHFYGVHHTTTIYSYYIILVVVDPFSVEVIPFPLPPEDLAAWWQSSAQEWADMAQEEVGERRLTMRRTSCFTSFGACEMHRACFRHYWDEHQMATEYVRRTHVATV